MLSSLDPLVSIFPSLNTIFLIYFLRAASSDIPSAIMSSAPFIASSILFTDFSSLINASACFSTVPLKFPSKIISARGFNPFSNAIVALVLFLGLKGLYMSSTSVRDSAFSNDFTISSVSFPCSSINLNTSSFLSFRFLKYVSLSKNFLNMSSLKAPVCSFLYLAIKGTVFPSSNNLITFCTCTNFIPNSFSNLFSIFTIVLSCKNIFPNTSIIIFLFYFYSIDIKLYWIYN